MEPKTTFHPTNNFSKPTPGWAKVAFRVTVVVTTVAIFVVAGTNSISDADKVEVSVWIKGVDALVLGLSQMFGIDIKPVQQNSFNSKNQNK